MTSIMHVQLNTQTVETIHQNIEGFEERFTNLSLQEARRELQLLGERIYEVRGEVRQLPPLLQRKMESSYAKLEALRNQLDHRESLRILGGADILLARGNQYHNAWGTAACGPIVGKALEQLLVGALDSQDTMDRVVKEGVEAYEQLIEELQGTIPEYYQRGTHLSWKQESENVFKETLKEVGEPILATLNPNEKSVYQEVLTHLHGRMAEGHIGGVLLIGREYLAVSLRQIKEQGLEICIFDSHGKYSLTKGNSPAFMVKVRSLEHAAELLAYRREYFETGDQTLNEVTCYPVSILEGNSQHPLVIQDPIELKEKELTPVVERHRAVVTLENRDQAVALMDALKQVEEIDSDRIEAIFQKHDACFLSCYKQVRRQVGEALSVKATLLVVQAELHFMTPTIIQAQREQAAPPILRSPTVAVSTKREKGEEVASPLMRGSYEERRALVVETAQTATLFIRDYVVDAVAMIQPSHQEVLLQHVEGWFEKFLPTLFFEGGQRSPDATIDLGFVSTCIGSLTTFLKDMTNARKAVESNQEKNWLYQRKELDPRVMERQILSHMRRSKDRVSDREVLHEFSTHMLTLYELKQGKALKVGMKEELAEQITAVLTALIDTVISPRFSQMLVLGFLEDDQIGEELLALSSTDLPEMQEGKVPPQVHQEITQFVSELIDFGNPRYSAWIATSMMKTHFMKIDEVGQFKAGYRGVMKFLSSPFFKDEIGAFLKNAFAIPKKPEGSQEEWVKTATVCVGALRRYGWDQGGQSLLGRVQTQENIPEKLYAKIRILAQQVSGERPHCVQRALSYVMPSVHNFHMSLTEKLYDLSQSKDLMRLYSVHYLIGDTLIPQLRIQCREHFGSIPKTPVTVKKESRTVSHEVGEKMSTLISDYLEKYISQLYLKQDSPLVSGVVDLGVSMIQKFVAPMITSSFLSHEPYTVPQQQMIVDIYGSIGPFLRDYTAAIQLAKEDPRFIVYEKQGKSGELIVNAMEKVRGASLKISDHAIEGKLEAFAELLVRAHNQDLTPIQSKLLQSSSCILPKLLKGTMDLLFAPQMMSLFVTNLVDSLRFEKRDDPDHQYQNWDDQVLLKWNENLLALVKGVVHLGEPKGKLSEIVDSMTGIGDLAQDHLGPLMARLSSGPSALLSPSATLDTLNSLEGALFGADKSRRMQNVFNASVTERAARQAELKAKLKGFLTQPLPLGKMQEMTQGWITDTTQGLLGLGHRAQEHVRAFTSTLPAGVSSSPSPLSSWAIYALQRQSEAIGLSGLAGVFSPEEQTSQSTVNLTDTLYRFFKGSLSDTLEGKDIVGEFIKGNPVVEYLDTSCQNMMQIFQSKELMRAYIYNYVLTPDFFRHLIHNIESQKGESSSSLALQLPGSLFLDMSAMGWVVPGRRNPALLDTPKIETGMLLDAPLPAYDYEGAVIALRTHFGDRERLFEASQSCPSISMLFQKLSEWEDKGIIEQGKILECVNTLETPTAFLENAKNLVYCLQEKGALSKDEVVALEEHLCQGEFPFVFRYIDLKMLESSPVIEAFFGSLWKERVSELFLTKAVGGLDGAFMQHIAILQLLKSYESWVVPQLKGKRKERMQMQGVLEMVAHSESQAMDEKLSYLFKETASYITNLQETEQLFLTELVKGLEEAEDPVAYAMRLFSIERAVHFWDRNIQQIHGTLEQLKHENPRLDMEQCWGEQLQAYYEKLGKLLSELLSDPLSDKLKMAFATKFLERYRRCAQEKAPQQGAMTSGRLGTVGSWNVGRAYHKFELIKAAQKSIVMSGCYFGGEIFDQALDLIGEQLVAKPDLDVKLIGSEYMLTPSNRMKISQLETDYPHRFLMQITPEVQYYKSPVSERSSYRTNHMKLLVIDYGKYFETGGSGVADRWELSGTEPMQTEGGVRPMEPLAFRDVDYLFQDQDDYGVGYALYLELLSLFPVWSAKNIKERIAHAFDARFNHVQPPSKADVASIPWGFSPSDGVTFYSSGPDQKDNQLYIDLLQDVRDAQSRIVIQHMYFHPPQELLEALVDASNRGVDILIYTNRDGVDMPFTHSLYAELSRASWKSLYEGVAKSNVYVFEFNVANTTYHKKLILIDGKVTYLGSSNLGEKSLGMHDQEVDLRVVSATMGENILQRSIHEDQRLCFKHVPPQEACQQQINEAALAEVQSFLFKPWL